MVAMVISLLLITALATWMGWLLDRASTRESIENDRTWAQALAIIEKKDSRIAELDADYKALSESYIRETGKVFIKPVVETPDRLPPSQPNPWKTRPPRWADPTKVKEANNG